MFLAIVFIAIGVLLLLNALGIVVSGSLWGMFWAIVFLAVGLKMLIKKGKCPMCGWGMWHGGASHGSCCDHDHGNMKK
jgi:hypothetical protein